MATVDSLLDENKGQLRVIEARIADLNIFDEDDVGELEELFFYRNYLTTRLAEIQQS
jgi:hypothetical protein